MGVGKQKIAECVRPHGMLVGLTTMDAKTAGTTEGSFLKAPIVIALVLSLLLVVGVLIGAKMVYNSAATQPVSMSVLNSPYADSAECADLIDSLPEEFLGHQRAELVEPKPSGAAAWQSNSQERITLRCGVDLPLQYTALSPTTHVDGVEWLRVVDTTPQSTMQSWYTVNRFPVVAISTDALGLGDQDFSSAALSEALSALKEQEATPYPLPLEQVAATQPAPDSCQALADALPATIGENPAYARYEGDAAGDLTAVWTADGYESIEIRCGVDFPASYAAGAQLQQINDVTWFEDTTVGNGTTASTWFALGRETVVAVSVPQASGNAALVEFSKAIEETLAATD